MIATLLLLSGCGGDIPADLSECPTPGGCSAEQQPSESFTDSASTACVDGTDCPSDEGARLGLSVPSMADDCPMDSMSANASLERLPSTNRPSADASTDPTHEAIFPSRDPPLDVSSDLQVFAGGLFESVGVQPEDVPELLSLMLDGLILDALGGGASPSLLGSPREEVPGRFPTFLELLCREDGHTDSQCRQRFGQ